MAKCFVIAKHLQCLYKDTVDIKKESTIRALLLLLYVPALDFDKPKMQDFQLNGISGSSSKRVNFFPGFCILFLKGLVFSVVLGLL